MGLHFFKSFLEKFSGGSSKVSAQEITCSDFFDLTADVYARELAFWSCTNLVVKAISNCEFQTFISGKVEKRKDYYRWNIEPNKNQSSSEFFCQLISQLYRKNEALVIDVDGQLLVADDWSVTPYAIYEDVFTGVSVKGFTFNRSFTQSEVFYFRLSSQDMKKIVNGICDAYQKMLDYAMKSYAKSRGTKGIITIDTMATRDEAFKREYERLLNGDFTDFFNRESAIFTLYNGFHYTDLGSKTYSNEGTRDIRAMIDDISAMTAKAFSIHPALVSGDVAGTGEALSTTLTFCIDPLAKILEQGINRKIYGYEGYSKGNYLRIDTSHVLHIDLLEASTPIDKLISSGMFSINDLLQLLGRPEIDEDWAKRHYITKNYAETDQMPDQTKGERNE